MDFRKRFRVPFSPKGAFDLDSIDPGSTPGLDDKESGKEELERQRERLDELQRVFYADARRALLVVLQAMDTGGKDGTVRAVLGRLNPQGVQVRAFKKPTEEEAAHDYLWRIHRWVPRKGLIGVFNRSHYEDILVPSVLGAVPRRALEARYGEINAFEGYLAANGVAIVKLFLHISREEQRERLQERLDDPAKRWKFDPRDLESRKLWPRYMEAYSRVLARTSTPWAPWYAVPADRNWYRNAVVARILAATLEDLKPRYPAPPEGLDRVRIPK